VSLEAGFSAKAGWMEKNKLAAAKKYRYFVLSDMISLLYNFISWLSSRIFL
jgi:hypothetical protein